MRYMTHTQLNTVTKSWLAMIKPNKHHHHIVNDSCVLDGCELRHSSDTNELDEIVTMATIWSTKHLYEKLQKLIASKEAEAYERGYNDGVLKS